MKKLHYSRLLINICQNVNVKTNVLQGVSIIVKIVVYKFIWSIEHAS